MEDYLDVIVLRVILVLTFLTCFVPFIFPDKLKYEDIWTITSDIKVNTIKYDTSNSGYRQLYSLGFTYVDKHGKPGSITPQPSGTVINNATRFDVRSIKDGPYVKWKETKTVYTYRIWLYLVWCISWFIGFIILHSTAVFPSSYNLTWTKRYTYAKFEFGRRILKFFGYNMAEVNCIPTNIIETTYTHNAHHSSYPSFSEIFDLCMEYNLEPTEEQSE